MYSFLFSLIVIEYYHITFPEDVYIFQEILVSVLNIILRCSGGLGCTQVLSLFL